MTIMTLTDAVDLLSDAQMKLVGRALNRGLSLYNGNGLVDNNTSVDVNQRSDQLRRMLLNYADRTGIVMGTLDLLPEFQVAGLGGPDQRLIAGTLASIRFLADFGLSGPLSALAAQADADAKVKAAKAS